MKMTRKFSAGQKVPDAMGSHGKEELIQCVPTTGFVHWETKHGTQHFKDVLLEKSNWRAGLTVALVSVPLSISLGIASGTTPMRGLTTAIFGGFCSSVFGSSDYNIVGPAGALSGMFTSYVYEWGDDVLPYVSLVSAVIVAVCSLLGLHKYMLLMPTSVFEGFTVGVALIIGLNQINFAFGVQPDQKHKHFFMNVYESVGVLNEVEWPTFILFAVEMPLLYILMRKIPALPWTVIIPLLSIPIGALAEHGVLGFELLTLKSKYGMLEPKIVEELKPFATVVPSAEIPGFLIAAFSTAVVAVLETLISAKIASTRVDRGFNQLLEMRGLTIGHLVCGLTGAMPPTGVFVRTSLNASLGATHRFSQGLNAVVVCIISMACMPVFSYIPQATIAAVLVVASIRMTPITYLKQLWREDRRNLALCMITALICVFEDPVIGLAAGMIIALLINGMDVQTSDSLTLQREESAVMGGPRYTITPMGSIVYLNADAFVAKCRNLPDAVDVVLNLENVCMIDHDGLTALKKVVTSWVAQLEGLVERVRIVNVKASTKVALQRAEWFQKAVDAGAVSFVDSKADDGPFEAAETKCKTLEAATSGDLPLHVNV